MFRDSRARVADAAPGVAACPHAYFVQYLLGSAVEEPGDESGDHADRQGQRPARRADRFHREVIVASSSPDEHGWSAIHRTRLVELFVDTAARYEHWAAPVAPYWRSTGSGS